MEPAGTTEHSDRRQVPGREMPPIDTQAVTDNQFMRAAQITQSARILHSRLRIHHEALPRARTARTWAIPRACRASPSGSWGQGMCPRYPRSSHIPHARIAARSAATTCSRSARWASSADSRRRFSNSRCRRRASPQAAQGMSVPSGCRSQVAGGGSVTTVKRGRSTSRRAPPVRSLVKDLVCGSPVTHPLGRG